MAARRTAMLRDGAEEERHQRRRACFECGGRAAAAANSCGGSWLLERVRTGYLSGLLRLRFCLRSTFASRQDADARKSSSSALTRSGASSVIQWSTPAMRLVAPRSAHVRAESAICGLEQQPKSPSLHTPIAGAVIGGAVEGAAEQRLGRDVGAVQVERRGQVGRVRRAAPRPRPRPGWRDQSRKFCQPSCMSHCSAMSTNWNRSMYQDFSRWAMPARLKAPGCPTESAVRDAHAVGREDREHPRDRRAPVVADDVHAFDAEMVEHADEVA